MTRGIRWSLFLFFALSGGSGLLYQIVWVRMALAAFGVITPFASVVVSVFMLGLALGTWLGGRIVGPASERLGGSPLLLYGAAELGIAVSAIAVPWLLEVGRVSLLPIGGMASGGYLIASSLWIALTMLPFCMLMGASFPFVMAFVRSLGSPSETSFSFLYLANVLGALLGALLTPLALIELLGFRSSLWLAASANVAIAVGTVLVVRRLGSRPPAPPDLGDSPLGTGLAPDPIGLRGAREREVVLFVTGFTAMALEIVWLRAFTPVLGTLVYAFSGLLAVYLLSTWLGSVLYRRRRAAGRPLSWETLIGVAAITVLLPIAAAIPELLTLAMLPLRAIFGPALEAAGPSLDMPLTLLSIAPFCTSLGALTPALVDAAGQGDPRRAAGAYTINIAGSILGPLFAAYIALPWLGARGAMLLLFLPYLVLVLRSLRKPAVEVAGQVAGRGGIRLGMASVAVVATLAALPMAVSGRSFEEGGHLRDVVVRRDHTATVISYGERFDRHLLVNGYGMTVLTSLTKVMAHLPLATLDHEPKRALVIAFGMGTTFRSLLSWNLQATVVELVPSVVDAFPYYFDDAEETLNHPAGTIVIDDGRRFLARTDQKFDLITIDPPPPVETAGSSLLYAEEFYVLAKRQLAPRGIVHQWFPDGIDVEPTIREAVLRSIRRSFPHVRVFQSMHGRGLHLLCSMEPIEIPNAQEFISRLPASARADLREWLPPNVTTRAFLQQAVLSKELSFDSLAGPLEGPSITDDRPLNEYFALRRLGAWLRGE